MADTAPVMIWVSGLDKGCTFFNQVWLDYTGRTMEQELGDGWAESVHPQDLDRCMEIYSSSFDARRRFQMEYRLRRADGEYRWMLDNGVPRFEPGDVFAGFIGSCVDITDLKRAQDEYVAKQKMETVGALAGGIAHDFNNLLGGVLAYSELALADLASGLNPREALQAIRDATIQGAGIVRQLMIYAGHENEVVELVDISEIVSDMIGLLKLSVSKHVTIETDFAKGVPAVRANPSQIRQVVMNLITNASEAIGDREGTIRVITRGLTVGRDSPVETSEDLAAGDYFQLEVSDTGTGMTPEVQAKIFDPFFTTKRTGSHGVGLVVVKRIVQRFHGTIRVSSAPGNGARFQILLPCEQNAVQATRSQISPARAATPGSFQEATVLIVEDEDLLRDPVAKMLRKRGWSVIEARDGSAALEVIRAEANHIDVLFLDITLPGTSSREVYEEAKRLRPYLQVIVTSAKTKQMAEAALATGVERFLRKPFRLADLVEMIRANLSSERRQSASG